MYLNFDAKEYFVAPRVLLSDFFLEYRKRGGILACVEIPTHLCSSIQKAIFQVTGRFINGPGIVFRERSASREETHHVYPHDGKWKFEMPLYRPARIDKWALYGLFSQNDQRSVNYNMIVEFGKRLMREAAKKGVEIDAPADCRVSRGHISLVQIYMLHLGKTRVNNVDFFQFWEGERRVDLAHTHALKELGR